MAYSFPQVVAALTPPEGPISPAGRSLVSRFLYFLVCTVWAVASNEVSYLTTSEVVLQKHTLSGPRPASSPRCGSSVRPHQGGHRPRTGWRCRAKCSTPADPYHRRPQTLTALGSCSADIPSCRRWQGPQGSQKAARKRSEALTCSRDCRRDENAFWATRNVDSPLLNSFGSKINKTRGFGPLFFFLLIFLSIQVPRIGGRTK